MHIGSFHRTRHGFEGRIYTLGLDLPLAIVPAEPSDAENAPDWRVHIGESSVGPEAGAGWDRTGDKAGRQWRQPGGRSFTRRLGQDRHGNPHRGGKAPRL